MVSSEERPTEDAVEPLQESHAVDEVQTLASGSADGVDNEVDAA